VVSGVAPLTYLTLKKGNTVLNGNGTKLFGPANTVGTLTSQLVPSGLYSKINVPGATDGEPARLIVVSAKFLISSAVPVKVAAAPRITVVLLSALTTIPLLLSTEIMPTPIFLLSDLVSLSGGKVSLMVVTINPENN
jgi:hypothetical protein